MRTAPWLKRIDRSTGALTSHALKRDELFFIDDEGHLEGEGESWHYATPQSAERRWLLHGSAIDTATSIFVFMEYPELRHAELEAALRRDDAGTQVYADWLEEHDDPFAGALHPALLKERGPAGLWWMEGFERSGNVDVVLHAGFARSMSLRGVASRELPSMLYRMGHVRAFMALEHLSIDARSLITEQRDWAEVVQWPVWAACQWPPSLQRLAIAPQFRGMRSPTPDQRRQLQTALRHVKLELSVKGQ